MAALGDVHHLRVRELFRNVVISGSNESDSPQSTRTAMSFSCDVRVRRSPHLRQSSSESKALGLAWSRPGSERQIAGELATAVTIRFGAALASARAP